SFGVDFYDAKGDVEALLSPLEAQFKPAEHPAMHPGRCASVWLDGRNIGVIGELHPRWRQRWELAHAPVLFELDLDAVIARQVAAFEPVPKFQPAQRDIAVIVATPSPTPTSWMPFTRPIRAGCCARRCCSTSTSPSRPHPFWEAMKKAWPCA